MSLKIKPRRGRKSDIYNALLNSEENEMLIALDTKEIFIADGQGAATKMTDVIFVNSANDLTNIQGVPNKIYICYLEKKVFAYDGSNFLELLSDSGIIADKIEATNIITTQEKQFVSEQEKSNWDLKPNVYFEEIEGNDNKKVGDFFIADVNF